MYVYNLLYNLLLNKAISKVWQGYRYKVYIPNILKKCFIFLLYSCRKNMNKSRISKFVYDDTEIRIIYKRLLIKLTYFFFRQETSRRFCIIYTILWFRTLRYTKGWGMIVDSGKKIFLKKL